MFISKFLLFSAATASLLAQVEPAAANWATWVLPSSNTVRLPPPPDDAATADEINTVKSAIAQRTPDDLKNIAYWDAGAPSYRWMQIAAQIVASENPAATLSTRAMALVSVAIHDATVAAWDTKYAYNRPHPADLSNDIKPMVSTTNSPSYPNEHAVTAGAAAVVLAYLFPDQKDALMQMEAHALNSRVSAGAAFPSDVSRGMELGEKVGRMVIQYAQTDGSDQVNTVAYPGAAGVWGNANPVTPLAGTWRPWVLAAGNQFRLDPPPPFGSPDANMQYDMVKNLARNNATNHSAWFWQPSFIFPWLDATHREIFENHLDSNAPRAARVYALETIAQHDATIACWDTKYAYLELRPSMADPTITTLFANPGHPGYPSGHACASQAAATMLSYLFPLDAVALQAMGTDAGMSTFDAGIHTLLDVQQGFALGRMVGNAVIDRSESDGSEEEDSASVRQMVRTR